MGLALRTRSLPTERSGCRRYAPSRIAAPLLRGRTGGSAYGICGL